MYTTTTGHRVPCITANDDGTLTFHLHKHAQGAPNVILEEPTAIQYARFRVAMVEADAKLETEVPRPIAPTFPDGMTDGEAGVIAAQYQLDYNEWLTGRENRIRSVDAPVYLSIILDIIEQLGERKVTMDDLPVSAFDAWTCRAIKEVWETPLGGRVVQSDPEPDPGLVSEVVAAQSQATEEAPGESPADSPESAPSSPPGTAPSGPVPPES